MNDLLGCPCSVCGVQQQALCANCCNEMIEVIRNSCIELDSIKHASQEEINRVFEISMRLQIESGNKPSTGRNEAVVLDVEPKQKKSRTPDTVEFPEEVDDHYSQEPLINKNIPIASSAAIKVLTQQLLKLQIVNEKVKVIGIEKTIDSYKKKNAKTSTQVQNLKSLIESERAKLESSSAKITENYSKRNLQLENDKVFEYLKISRVKKQALRLQEENYNILREIVFSKSKGSNNSYLSKLKGKKQLLFFKQPIINIENFFAYNSKLEQLNTFLESLITLQMKLVEVFDDDLSTHTLPHLKELENFLPNSKFFALVKEKEVQMIGNNEDENENEDLDEQQAPENLSVVEDGAEGTERTKTMINLGDATKLPLSSKTINNQRRKSIREEKDGSPRSNASPKGKKGNIKEAKGKKTNKPTEKNGKSPLIGKRVVIIPHKIITKPFTKLTPKEFIKFLQIIIKILINFKVIFKHTKALNEVYKFDSILQHVTSMGDEYFETKLKMIESNAESIKIQGTQPEETSSQLIENSLMTSPSSGSISQMSKKSSISNIYSRIFGPTREQLRKEQLRLPSTPKIISGGTFGNVSEMRDSFESDSNQIKDNGSSREELDINTGNRGSEMKVTMQRVYQIMTGGGNNKMISSRTHLDDWDVISKMM
ncbi:hypothetical protein CLIB1423_16S00430 [[Candida] railenensis]|uniref:Uncharacterized protein n=1 Tax=[Candida] railenensis TaxID=45579 RepID=A0A9P0QU45_9ASCO|nr:hypothetical protein CLIB1423_16S00430 [[Candida] railenensis]